MINENPTNEDIMKEISKLSERIQKLEEMLIIQRPNSLPEVLEYENKTQDDGKSKFDAITRVIRGGNKENHEEKIKNARKVLKKWIEESNGEITVKRLLIKFLNENPKKFTYHELSKIFGKTRNNTYTSIYNYELSHLVLSQRNSGTMLRNKAFSKILEE